MQRLFSLHRNINHAKDSRLTVFPCLFEHSSKMIALQREQMNVLNWL